MRISASLGALAVAGFVSLFGQTASVQATPLPLAVSADTVLSGVCVLSSRFKAGERVIFRVRVLDTATGEPVDASGLTSVMIKMADGSEHAAKYGPHPPSPVAGYYWTFAWTVPADYPTGSFPYTVVATTLGGEAVTFVPFEAPNSQLMIVAAQ